MAGAGVVGSPELALAAGRWREAGDGFLRQLADRSDAGAHAGLAQALWWLDDGVGCLEQREAAYRAYRRDGEDALAARAAGSLAYDSFLFGEGEAVARGWWGRAAALLEPLPQRAEHGWLAVREAELALVTGLDPEVAQVAADRARAIGRRTGDPDLTYVGLALTGLAQVTAGDVAAGVPHLDSAVAAATTGEVADLMWMGKIFCWLITACQATHDLARAEEWCRRVEVVCRRCGLDPLFTVCRIQHSSVLIARGSWPGAEQRLTPLTADGATSSRWHTRLDAVVQLGELRRRQGRLDEASDLLRQAEFEPAAIVSRALIMLARGDADRAWATIEALLCRTSVQSRLLRARLLLPAIRTSLLAGQREAAEAAATELREIAAHVGTDALAAMAAAGSAMLATGAAAVTLWDDAVRAYLRAGLPFDEAESRLWLAEALLSCGDLVAATEQAARGAEGLRAMGADPAHARALVRDIARAGPGGGASPGGLSRREVQVLRLVAAGRTNEQIAVALTLSPHTVHRHVANILTKLDASTRAGAAVHAVTHELI